MEEVVEALRQRLVEQHRARPALTGAEGVAVRETPARHQPDDVREVEPPCLEVGHVHVVGVEPGPVERERGLDVAVDALLAQDGHLRPRPEVHIGRRHVVGGVEGRRDDEPGVAIGPERLVLLRGALRVVAQRRDAPRHLVPGLCEVTHRLLDRRLTGHRHANDPIGCRPAHHRDHVTEAVAGEHLEHLGGAGGGHPEHGTELFGEQRSHRRHVELDPHGTGKSHLAHRSPQATVGPVVVRHVDRAGPQVGQRRHEREQQLRVVEVRNRATELTLHLPQDRPAQPVATSAEVDEHEHVARAQLRGPRATHVGQRGERRHDERHRRGDLARLPGRGIRPAGAHRQRVLADRHRHPELGEQLHRDGLDGVEQRSVLAVLTAGGHPVARQLDPGQRRQRRCEQVGQRFPDRHPTRRGSVDRGHRHPLARGHRLTREADVVGQGHSDVGDGHLPRPDHLVAVGQPADRAVGDRHEEPLGRDRRMPQHGIRGVLQVQPGEVQGARVALHAGHVAHHLRWLAEQHLHRHVDGAVLVVEVVRAVGEHEAAVVAGDPDDGVGAALTLAQRREQRQ